MSHSRLLLLAALALSSVWTVAAGGAGQCNSPSKCLSNAVCDDDAGCCGAADVAANPGLCSLSACMDLDVCADENGGGGGGSTSGNFHDQNCCAMCSCNGDDCHNPGGIKSGRKVFAKCGTSGPNSEWKEVAPEYPTYPSGYTYAANGVTVQCQCNQDNKDYALGEVKGSGNGVQYYCGTIP